MKNILSNKFKVKELLLWLGIFALTFLTFFSYYWFYFAAYVNFLLWVTWFSLSVILLFFTSKGKQLIEFFKGAKIELQKVVWPSRQETIQTTSIVMIMVAITSIVLWGVDSIMIWAIGKLTHLG